MPKRQEDQTATAQERNLNHRASAPANGAEVEVEVVEVDEEEEDREVGKSCSTGLCRTQLPSVFLQRRPLFQRPSCQGALFFGLCVK